jgi:tRNA(Ile)-lysidine synthase
MNLLRGSGLDGLSGMSARSGDIVRPFLQVSREMIIQALHAGGEPYRIDRSNADLGSRRNLLRHRVLPLLEGIHPTAGTTIARASNLLAEDASYLRTEAELALGYMDARFQPEHASANTRVFRVLHPAVQGRILRLLVGTVQGHVRDLSQDHISVMREAIMGSGSGRSVGSQFPHGLHLEVTGDRFHLFHAKPALESSPIAATLPIPGDLEWVHGRLQATLVSAEAHEVLSRQLAVCGPYHAFCDADVLGDHLLVRSRRPGDRLDSIHARGSNKLQDLFVDAKIPLHQRDRIPVLATPDFVAWVPGFGVHRRASVGPSTRRVAHMLFRSFL